LTDHQKEKVRQVRAAYGLMLEVRSKFYIVGALIKEFQISQVSAYRIIKNTELLFGDLGKSNKEIKRQIAEEMAKEAYRIAKYKGETKEMISAARAYNEASGITRDDPEVIDFDKIQPSLIVMVLPEGMEQQLQQLLSAGLVNLNKFLPEETIDIEHEELESKSKGTN
jgi:hypothetical protein